MDTTIKRARLKPDTSTAMNNLIAEVRQAIDFDLPQATQCNGPCTGCSKKLLEFLDTELQDWEYKLAQDQSPSFGDLRSLAKKSNKIYRILKRNGIIDKEPTESVGKLT